MLCILFSFIIGKNIITKPLDDTYEILSKVKDGTTTTYEVKGMGYAGKGSIKLKIIFTNNNEWKDLFVYTFSYYYNF